ncbi:MAG: hypothetical protein HUK04_00245 [Bacteroidaceae bacterium]|nr:hypothetical protein [Bacteroidaceae bacterium]
MKTKHKNTPKQWATMTALVSVGFLAFMVVAGDENPENPMNIGAFCLIKGAAMAVIYGCYRVGKILDRKGLLPEVSEDDENEMWED